EVDAGAEQVNTAKGVNTGSIKLSTDSEQVSTVGAEQVSTVSIKLSTDSEQVSTVGAEQISTVSAKKSSSSVDKGQREGKA
ncbi:hypothetical protein Tco_1381293, partial [Tanacetum coccineum]